MTKTTSIESLLAQADWARRLAYRLIRDDARADDLVQDAWLVALERPPAPGNVRGWVARVMQRLARDRQRESARRLRREEVAAVPDSVTDDVVERSRTHRRVVDAVLALSERYRDPLLLRFFDGLPPRVVAGRLGLPVETVRTRIRRGLALLRDRFAEEDGPDWRGALAPLAALTSASTGASTAAANETVLGALLMSSTIKLALAAATGVALLVAGLLLWLSSDSGGGPDLATERAVQTPDDAAVPRRVVADPASPTAAAGVVVAAPEAVPGPDGARTMIRRAAEPDTAVTGIVRDRRGDPVPAAEVWWGTGTELASLLEVVRARVSGRSGRAVETDEDGRYRLLVQPGTVSVAAYHPTLGHASRPLLAIAAGRTLALDLELAGGVIVSGQVVDARRRPVPEAPIMLMGGEQNGPMRSVFDVTTDADGRYRTHPLAFSSLYLSVRHDGFLDARRRLTIRDGETERTVDVELTTARRLRGDIVLADGSRFDLSTAAARIARDDAGSWRVENRAQVSASYDDPELDPNFLSLGHCDGKVLDDGGAYDLALDSESLAWLSLWIGSRLVAKAAIPDADPAPDLVVDPSRLPPAIATGDLVLRLVRSGDGEPVTRCAVRLHGSSRDGGTIRQPPRDLDSPSGVHELRGLRADVYELELEATGMAAVYRRRVPVSVGAPTELRIVMAPASARITGRVVDGNGQPVSVAGVRLLTSDGALARRARSVRETTDADGRFEIGDLAAGFYVVSILAEDFAPALVPVEANPTGDARVVLLRGVDVKFKPKGTSGPFAFRFEDARGLPLRDDDDTSAQRWGATWDFRLPEGDLVVQVTCPGYVSDPVAFHAEEGAVIDLELERER